MGTNFYLRATKPREVYNEVHIAKTSGGWLPLFEASDEYGIHSVRDMREMVASGEWEFVDEYGDRYTVEEFEERVVKFGKNFEYPLSHVDVGLVHFVDREGNEFTRREFS